MLEKTRGIVLRSVKFGDSSLVSTIFTEEEGVQSFLLKGIRNPKSGQSRSGLLQPGSLLDIVIYHNPQKNLQHLREFQPACHYTTIREEIVKNSISLFSIEVLLRVLPEHAPHKYLFEFAFSYFRRLDEMPTSACANFPLYFLVSCGRHLGYEMHGAYSSATPYPNPEAGCFTEIPAIIQIQLTAEDVQVLDKVVRSDDFYSLGAITLSSSGRLRLIDWYLSFLQYHTQHMGAIKSLSVLQTVLHQN